MRELIDINSTEYENLELFNEGIIDHVFVQPADESNKIMICHAEKNGTILYNGKMCTLSEIENEVKEELQVKSKYFYLDIACCNSQTLVPYVEKNCSIRPRYSNGDNLYYYYKSNQILFAWDQ